MVRDNDYNYTLSIDRLINSYPILLLFYLQITLFCGSLCKIAADCESVARGDKYEKT